ncbi:MAG: serine/threonine-protein kinase [Gemmatimonadota bacterium]
MKQSIEERLQATLEGNYKVERELGRGSMARVFLATDVRHGRAVAVKLLPPELATTISAERFLREIRITAALQHPHILPLLDSGASGGLCWYVMPHVTGESLRERLALGPFPPKDAIRIATEVAKALAHAHRQSIVHRDIKPENVMLSGGQAIVMDFGLARALSGTSGSRITAAGLPLGTPAYMSPEQVKGETIDARSDLYSLGCVLYEMLIGRPPFVAANAVRVMQLHIEQAPPKPSEARGGLPAALDPVMAKVLAKEPLERYQRAEALITDLEMAEAIVTVAGLGLGAPPPEEQQKSGWRKLLDRLGGR